MIRGARVNLVPLQERHLAATLSWVNDPTIAEFLNRATPVQPDEHAEWFTRIQWRDDCQYWAIETDREGQHIGNIWLWDIERRHKRAELRVMIGPVASTGLGLGTEAISLLATHAFEQLGLHKLYAFVLANNPRARRAFVKSGFFVEGILRKDRWSAGEYVDVFRLGRLQPLPSEPAEPSTLTAASFSPGDNAADARAEVERASRNYYFGSTQLGVDARAKKLVMDRCLSWVRRGRVLDLGFVDGSVTAALLEKDCRVDIVEAASRHVAEARAKFGSDPRVRVFDALFQEFVPDTTYDTIVAGDMIRYLPDPQAVLSRMRTWLAPGGLLIVTVPNRRSFHRLLGVAMGLEPSLSAPNARDIEVGNRRSYDRAELQALLENCAYRVEDIHGAFFKPLSSDQMQDFSPELLRGLLDVGDAFEDHAWFLWAVASSGTQRLDT